jgi:hypothetical protein
MRILVGFMYFFGFTGRKFYPRAAAACKAVGLEKRGLRNISKFFSTVDKKYFCEFTRFRQF